MRVIAAQVRRHRERKRPRMSAQALADRCAELGWPIKRSVLSNLESGYRETITVPELFVLAQALEVPPVDLVAPFGRLDQVEILPGVAASPAAVADWLAGARPLPGTRWASNTAYSYRMHDTFLNNWRQARQAARQSRERGDEGVAAAAEKTADQCLAALVLARQNMRQDGLVPPELPPELASVEGT